MSEPSRLQLIGSALASVADTESARFARTLGTALSQLERSMLALIGDVREGKRGVLAKVGRLLTLRTELRKALETSGYTSAVERASIEAVERMARTVASRRVVSGSASLGRVTGSRLSALARLMAADLLGVGEGAASRLWRAAVLAIYGNVSPDQLVTTLAKELDKTRAQAQTLFDTQVSIVGRQIVSEADPAEPTQAYLYVGPVDGVVRPFCLDHLGLVYTRDRIDALDNGQLPSVFVTGGGYSCRHSWLAVSDPALIALANTGQRAPGYQDRVDAIASFRRTSRRAA